MPDDAPGEGPLIVLMQTTKGERTPRLHIPLVWRGESTEKANSDYEHRAAACWRGPPFHRAAFGFAAQVFDSRTNFGPPADRLRPAVG